MYARVVYKDVQMIRSPLETVSRAQQQQLKQIVLARNMVAHEYDLFKLLPALDVALYLSTPIIQHEAALFDFFFFPALSRQQ